MPSILLIYGCEQPASPPQTTEAWPNSYEEVFQKAEVLKYSLQQDQLERQRLQSYGLTRLPPKIKTKQQ